MLFDSNGRIYTVSDGIWTCPYDGGPFSVAGFNSNKNINALAVNLADYVFVGIDKDGLYRSTTSPSAIGATKTRIAEFDLAQNHPNPFNPTTVISYTLAAASPASLTVYNMLGKEVATLVNGMQPAGQHEVRFEGVNFSSGVYLYVLRAGNMTVSRKMMLVK